MMKTKKIPLTRNSCLQGGISLLFISRGEGTLARLLGPPMGGTLKKKGVSHVALKSPPNLFPLHGAEGPAGLGRGGSQD